jgi:hypothetical protein
VKQNNSKKEKNEYNFDTLINIHRPYPAFMNFSEFGSNENMARLYKNYSCGTWL